MAFTLCTSGSAIDKAGANVNSAIIVNVTTLENWSNEAESAFCNMARFDVVTGFSGLTASGKEIAQEFCSSHIAQKIIGYEPEAIGISAATLRMNIMENNMFRVQQQLKDKNIKTYLNII